MFRIKKCDIDTAIIESKEIIQKEAVDFFAHANSPWHALSIDALLSQYDSKKNVGVIFIEPDAEHGYRINPSNFTFSGADESVFFKIASVDQSTIKKIRIGMKSALGYISAYNNYRKSSSRLRVISIGDKYRYPGILASDRGFSENINLHFISSYTNAYAHLDRVHDIRGQDNEKSGINVNQILRTGYDVCSMITREAYFSKSSAERYHLYYPDSDGVLRANSAVVKGYKNVLEEPSRYDDSKLLFVGQPLSERGIISEYVETKAAKAIGNYARERDINVMYKPHPRESGSKKELLEKIGCEVSEVTKSISAERLVSQEKINYIAGYFSTSLIKSSAFYNINTFTTANHIAHHTTNDELANWFKEYLRVSSRYVDPLPLQE